jgi:hypothetical protein
MHERLGARARRVEREPEAPQPARCRPFRRILAVPRGKVLGKPCEQHVPALITGRSWRIREQSLTRFRRLPLVFLQELDDQPPPRTEAGSAAMKRASSSAGNSQPQSSERGLSRTASKMCHEAAGAIVRQFWGHSNKN